MDIDVKYLIGLKPEFIIKYFKKKGYAFSWNWEDTWNEAHHKSFTVAKGMKLDILQDIKNGMDKAFNDGITYEQFKRDLKPVLKSEGWWGKVAAKDVPGYDPASGVDPEKIVQLGSPRRLETIYRTNIRTSTAAARWNAQTEQSKERPYLQYLQTQRPNKRPEHAKLHERVFRVNDPILNKIYPPNAFGCDCRMRSLTGAEVKELGLSVSGGSDYDDFQPAEGWDYNPGKTDYTPDLSQYDAALVKQYKKDKEDLNFAERFVRLFQ